MADYKIPSYWSMKAAQKMVECVNDGLYFDHNGSPNFEAIASVIENTYDRYFIANAQPQPSKVETVVTDVIVGDSQKHVCNVCDDLECGDELHYFLSKTIRPL